MRAHICVTGGAGYVGGQTVWTLVDRGIPVVVYDNLSTGHRRMLPSSVPLVVGDIRNGKTLAACLRDYDVEGVIHCAALALVPESVAHPGRYWSANVGGTGELVGAASACGVKGIVFSSSAAVYGEPDQLPIPERHPTRPINPYGHTKLISEQVLAESQAAGGPPWIAFRYFNAAGADPQTRCGELHDPETHIIPNILKVAARLADGAPDKNIEPLTLYGSDYPTPDGTCIRDYVHVADIADAHVRGLEYLLAGGKSGAFNIGTGDGVSLRRLVRVAGRITGKSLPMRIADRRPGDPAQLVADPSLAWEILGWRPKVSSLDDILAHAWAWERRDRG